VVARQKLFAEEHGSGVLISDVAHESVLGYHLGVVDAAVRKVDGAKIVSAPDKIVLGNATPE